MRPALTSNIKSAISRATSYFSSDTPKSSVERDPNVSIRAEKEDLFPKVDPAVDGPDCLQDCATCTIHYPPKFSIDLNDKLYGKVNGWSTHILVATGKTDWVRAVEDEQGSVMMALAKSAVQPSNGVCTRSISSATCIVAVTCMLAYADHEMLSYRR